MYRGKLKIVGFFRLVVLLVMIWLIAIFINRSAKTDGSTVSGCGFMMRATTMHFSGHSRSMTNHAKGTKQYGDKGSSDDVDNLLHSYYFTLVVCFAVVWEEVLL